LLSQQLNHACFCISLNETILKKALAKELGSSELAAMVEERCPSMFSARPVFIAQSQLQDMAALVQAVEEVVSLPAYRDAIFVNSPDIARHFAGGTKGVFLGFDFHVVGDRVRLIEINTNAGGAMLNAVMSRAHRACCLDDDSADQKIAAGAAFEQEIVGMFVTEWALAGHKRALKTVAIVDTSPQQQYLYPDFILFQRLFERHGIAAVIADPSELSLREQGLYCGEVQIDLVYNRLTDFMLQEPENRVLHDAYLAGAAVVTPHPQAHALYADKRNLARLSDEGFLRKIGVSPTAREILLSYVLKTEVVNANDAERLWNARRRLFFKPSAGYGSKAAYRGDKLTKRVWQDILLQSYVAQEVMSPGARVTGDRASPVDLKFDIRCFAYQGKVQWTAARLYQGQTTNFRTPGGGFAPVYCLPDSDIEDEMNRPLHAELFNRSSCCVDTCG
jgi:hypothetical protein